MTVVEIIRQPIISKMQLYNDTFAEALSTENPMLLNINDYVLEKSGDQFRPMITLLSAALCDEVNLTTINGALSLELLHIASVIHDDVVDQAIDRIGTPPPNNTHWTNKIAILSGDYILSKSLACGIHTDNLPILKTIASIGMKLSDGELLKLMSAKISSESESNYFQMVSKKTACLFATCAEVGGLSVNASAEKLLSLRNFGEYLGISFQLAHDIKHLSSDLWDGKVTLPLIAALQQNPAPESEFIIQWIDQQAFTADNVKQMQAFILSNGGIESTKKQMQAYKQKAINELNGFADSDVKRSLLMCAEYAVQE